MSAQSTNLHTLFWIPVRKKPFKNHCVREDAELVIKDPGFFSLNSPLLVRIDKRSKKKFKVIISPYNSESAKAHHIFDLYHTDKDETGFVEFKIVYHGVTGKSLRFVDVWNALSIQVYRITKNIFHLHKFHRKDDYFIDSSIPYSSIPILSNSSELDKYHTFYLEYITNKVKYYREFLLNKVENRFTLKNKYGFFRFRIGKLLKIRRYVDRIVGIIDYLGILFDIDHEFLEKLDWYTRDIHRIKREVSETYNAKRSTASVFLGYMGLFLGLLSIGLSGFWSIRSSNTRELLEQKHDSISCEHGKLIEDKFGKISERLDKTDSLIRNLEDSNVPIKIDTIIKMKEGIQMRLTSSDKK